MEHPLSSVISQRILTVYIHIRYNKVFKGARATQTILIAEVNHGFRYTLYRILAKYGYRVLIAAKEWKP